ncbi:unnamed protein product [Merluccius merluccius]
MDHLAMQLSQSQPLYQLLAMSSLRSSMAQRPAPKDGPGSPFSSLSSSLSSTPSSSPPSSPDSSPGSSPYSSLTSEPRSCLRRSSVAPGGGSSSSSSFGSKKRVVFADAVGRALTAVRLFLPEPAQTPVAGTLSRPRLQTGLLSSLAAAAAPKPQVTTTPPQPQPSQPQPSQPPPPPMTPSSSLLKQRGAIRRQYQLKFASSLPPMDFSQGLKEGQVQLESCSVTERGLMGTARVAHSGAERAVRLHVTFDAWRNHRSVPCILLLQRCGNTETDVFAFHLPLPRTLLDPGDGVEFCLSMQVQDAKGVKVHWDKNRGQNYRVVCMEQGKAAGEPHAGGAEPPGREAGVFPLHRPHGHPLERSM